MQLLLDQTKYTARSVVRQCGLPEGSYGPCRLILDTSWAKPRIIECLKPELRFAAALHGLARNVAFQPQLMEMRLPRRWKFCKLSRALTTSQEGIINCGIIVRKCWAHRS